MQGFHYYASHFVYCSRWINLVKETEIHLEVINVTDALFVCMDFNFLSLQVHETMSQTVLQYNMLSKSTQFCNQPVPLSIKQTQTQILILIHQPYVTMPVSNDEMELL